MDRSELRTSDPKKHRTFKGTRALNTLQNIIANPPAVVAYVVNLLAQAAHVTKFQQQC